jgi:hypothetical protein
MMSVLTRRELSIALSMASSTIPLSAIWAMMVLSMVAVSCSGSLKLGGAQKTKRSNKNCVVS